MRIMTAQINPSVKYKGSFFEALERNYHLHLTYYQKAVDLGADIVVFPELSLCGYPPEDLLLRPDYIKAVAKYKDKLKEQLVESTAMLIGLPMQTDTGLYNAAAFLSRELETYYYKQKLPNYAVFDEQRYFKSADTAVVIPYKGIHLGIAICEDLWFEESFEKLKSQGAELILSLNASPFQENKFRQRVETMQKGVIKTAVPLIYVNIVGGQDELVFDGRSFVMTAEGAIGNRHKAFAEDALIIEFTKEAGFKDFEPYQISDKPLLDITYKALILGLKDYLKKHGCEQVLIGISGGVDSALVAAIACDAIGADNVKGIALPSQYTSELSMRLAYELSEKLGFELLPDLNIQKSVNQLSQDLADSMTEPLKGVAAENIQARMRGNILMSISNQKGWFVLTTGNKSELSVGYATLYGDMNGGFNPIKDVYKTRVFELCHYVNANYEKIPTQIITRPPSAELAPDQEDSDSLPAYDVLDDILKHLIEQRTSLEVLYQKQDKKDVDQVLKLLERAEYKRRQAAPGTKITDVAFGKDYRMPL